MGRPGCRVATDALARPAAGLSRDQLQARLDVLLSGSGREDFAEGESRLSAPVCALHDIACRTRPRQARVSRRDLAAVLAVAMGLVSIVLLIACVNVAQSPPRPWRQSRSRSRLAFGDWCGRGRIIRQRLVESVMLAAAGTAVGALVASFASAGLVGLIAQRVAGPGGSIMALDIAPNWRLLVVCAVVVMTTTMFGLLPALHAPQASRLGAVANSGAGESHTRFMAALIVAQVCYRYCW